jgi:hypothetical protein
MTCSHAMVHMVYFLIKSSYIHRFTKTHYYRLIYVTTFTAIAIERMV